MEFLHCLDLAPHARAVLEKLKTEVEEHGLEDTQRQRREAELRARIANLEGYLGSDDPEREETYWRLISEAKIQLDFVKQRPTTAVCTLVDLERVTYFLENLEDEWQGYPSRLRNRLLTLLVDRVELRHDSSHIEATIVWKVGLRQVVDIKRPSTNFSREKIWRSEEDSLLRMLWPSSSQETLIAAFPGRSLSAINQRASKLKVNREWVRTNTQIGRPWTKEDKEQLSELYANEVSVSEIGRKLERSKGAVTSMASLMGIYRPQELRHRKAEPTWETMNIKGMHEVTSQTQGFA